MIQRTKGAQSIVFAEAPYIMSSASVVGKKESEGPLGELFDTFDETNLFGEETWELAEGVMQREACVRALHKANVTPEQVRYLFGGDLLRQGIATSMGAESLQIPLFGLFGACSTSGEALALAAMCVAAGYGERMLAVTFWNGRKGVSVSIKLCKPETLVCTVDGDRKRCISGRQ